MKDEDGIRHRAARTRAWAAGALAVSLAIVALGCGSDDGDDSGSSLSSISVTAEEVKNASGEISVLGWAYLETEEQSAGNVQAKWSYPSTGPSLITKARTGNYDVVVSESAALPALSALGTFGSIDTSVVEGYDEIIPELREEFTTPEGDVIGIPFTLGPWVTAYDSSKVPEPQELEDLLDPAYRDSIALQDDALLVGQIAMEQGVEDMSQMTQEDLDRAMAFLEDLRPNVKSFFQIGEDTQLFNNGSITVSMASIGSTLAGAIENNPAIKFNFVAAGTFVDAWSITQDADASAAISYVNESLTVPGQTTIAEASLNYPAIPEALPALEQSDDPFAQVLAGMSLSELLEEAPILDGYSPEGEGDVVSIDEVIRAWDEYKASF